jgi:hypothetical protein
LNDADYEVTFLEDAEIPMYEVSGTLAGRMGVNFVEVEFEHNEDMSDATSQLRWSRFVCTFQFAEEIRNFGEAPASNQPNIEAVLETDVFDETPWIADYTEEENWDNLASTINWFLASDAGIEVLETAIVRSDRRVKGARLRGARVAFGLNGTTLEMTLQVERAALDIGKKGSSKRQLTARIDGVTYEFVASLTELQGAPVLVFHSAEFVSRGGIDIDAQRAGAWFGQAVTNNNSERAQMEAHLHDAAEDLRLYLQRLVLAPSNALLQIRDPESLAIATSFEVPSLSALIGGGVGSNAEEAALDLSLRITRAEIAHDEDRSGTVSRVDLGSLAMIDPVGVLRPRAGIQVPGTPQIVDNGGYGRSGNAPVQGQVRWNVLNEMVYAYWATGALDGVVLGSDRFGDVGALSGLPSCVRFELESTAPPTLTGAGAGRVRAEFPGIRLTARVAPDAVGECTAISEFLPLWVQLGVVAEVELDTPGDALVRLSSTEITELYVSADDWGNLMLALVLAGTADVGDLLTTELGPVDEGVNGLVGEIVDALLGSLPLNVAVPTIPLGDTLGGAFDDVIIGGASELAVTDLQLGGATGAYVDETVADRARIVIDASMELR